MVPLRAFDVNLAGRRTPDWYLYLRASEAAFDALVTRDWHQSEQPEELWVLSRTSLSIITWRRPIGDPVREWGQLLAYLPEARRMITQHGPSIVFLPSPQLSRESLRKASEGLGELARELGISNQQVRDQACEVVSEELAHRGETRRFSLSTCVETPKGCVAKSPTKVHQGVSPLQTQG